MLEARNQLRAATQTVAIESNVLAADSVVRRAAGNRAACVAWNGTAARVARSDDVLHAGIVV